MTETSNGGILRYADLATTACGAEHTWRPQEGTGLHFVCEKPRGHEGMHGSGPFVEYSTEWPAAVGDRDETRIEQAERAPSPSEESGERP